MNPELPDWIRCMAWPDGVTVQELLAEAPEVLFQPTLKSEMQAVWEQRLKDAVTMGNEPWRARTQFVCNWLSTASDDLKMLLLGKKRKSMLIDERNRTALPM